MTALQARLLAGRAVRAAQAQEDLARRLRPAPEIPAQRSAAPSSTTFDVEATPPSVLSVVPASA